MCVYVCVGVCVCVCINASVVSTEVRKHMAITDSQALFLLVIATDGDSKYRGRKSSV